MSNLISKLSDQPVSSFMSVDHVVIFNDEDDRLYFINQSDALNANFDDLKLVEKASDLKELTPIRLIGTKEFISKHPDSMLQEYIDAEHTSEVSENITLYTAAYIHLFRLYKSFSTLTRESYCNFVDGFIDCCMSENTDHTATITYYDYDLYKILKLRKSVFTMFKNHLNDYGFYRELIKLQNVFGLRDNDFRKKKAQVLDYIDEALGRSEEEIISCEVNDTANETAPTVQAA